MCEAVNAAGAEAHITQKVKRKKEKKVVGHEAEDHCPPQKWWAVAVAVEEEEERLDSPQFEERVSSLNWDVCHFWGCGGTVRPPSR